MRLTKKQLRSLIESEVDKMRLPKGPNSRDDSDDDLTEDDDLEEQIMMNVMKKLIS